jgi:sec-independent protein translocase protein TatA
MIGNLRAPEILLILLVVVLLFGAKKLPDTARGLGRAMRIFKAETKGLRDDNDDDTPAPQAAPPAPRQIASSSGDVNSSARVSEPDRTER